MLGQVGIPVGSPGVYVGDRVDEEVHEESPVVSVRYGWDCRGEIVAKVMQWVW